MLQGLEGIAAMTSGPAQLQAFHELTLRAEARGMTPEELEIVERASSRVEKILHPETKQGDEMADETTAAPAAPPAKQKRQRGPNKPKAAPAPGEVTVKFTCSVADATELLGYFVRNQHPEIAHQLIDALAKAQKNGD